MAQAGLGDNAREATVGGPRRLRGGLIQQVASLDALDADLVERMSHEVLTVPDGWRAEYGEYQSGGWWTLSLINATGQAADVRIADCDPVETALLARMPVTRQLLRALGLRYTWVRLAKLRTWGAPVTPPAQPFHRSWMEQHLSDTGAAENLPHNQVTRIRRGGWWRTDLPDKS